MAFIHFDEAKAAATTALRGWLAGMADVDRALLIVDLYGKLRLAVWSEREPDFRSLDAILAAPCGPWWSGEVLPISACDSGAGKLYEKAWAESRPDAESAKLRVLDRHRTRTAWFTDTVDPLWEAPPQGPPIIVFYSFKGGLGRSTMLVSFAIQRARAGERVCVLDFDLDSPGVGTMLSADAEGLTARWGVVDYLLERSQPDLPLGDYYHRCDRVAGSGELIVFPAGLLNGEYADKLARLDLEEIPAAAAGGWAALLRHIQTVIKPHWILLDARTGISEPAGLLLSGVANLHVLLGINQSQSWEGLNRVLDRVGKERVLDDHPQSEVVLVHAMVPTGDAGKLAKSAFQARAENEFSERYYAEVASAEMWDTRDMDSLDAPHVSIPVEYDAKLAAFGDVADVAESLCAGPYAILAERIVNRFRVEGQE